MSNPLFEQLGGRQAAPQQMNPQQMVQQIKSNPAAMLQQRGLNIPGGMNDPQQIANYLIQSGQIPQSRLTWAIQMMQGRR